MRCRIVKNTLLPIAFSAILPAGYKTISIQGVSKGRAKLVEIGKISDKHRGKVGKNEF